MESSFDKHLLLQIPRRIEMYFANCAIESTMMDKYPAVWIENKSSEGSVAEVVTQNLQLVIHREEQQPIRWLFQNVQAVAVAGSIGKWYISETGRSFPRLLLEEPIPGINGMKSRRPAENTFTPGLWVLFYFILVISAIGLFLWKGLPLAADLAARQIPVEWEKKLGRQIREQILASLETDKEKTLIVNQLVRQIRFSTGEKDEFGKPELLVVKKMDFNAFALPGGTIVLHTGALEKLKDVPSLMALIGHENGHVQGRHSLRTLSRSFGLYALISMMLGDFTGVVAVLVDNAQSLQTLSYSRDFEREADEAGFQFLCRNELPVSGLVSLMETMQKEGEKNGLDIPGMLSSHPLTEERLATAIKKAKEEGGTCRLSSVSSSSDSLFALLRKP